MDANFDSPTAAPEGLTDGLFPFGRTSPLLVDMTVRFGPLATADHQPLLEASSMD